MKKILLMIISTMIAELTFCQRPEDVVERQLKAYNARDIDSFMTVFHEEIEIWNLGTDQPTYIGWNEVKNVYHNLFERSPELQSTIVHRTVIGQKVIDHERIVGRNGSKDELEIIMIYEVEDNKIRRAWAVRE